MTAPDLPRLALADLLPTASVIAPALVAPSAPATTATPVMPAALPTSDPGSAEPSDPEPIPASDDARRVACAILEVLAGVRSISDTAVVLGVSSARYYQLEARALQGLVQACEPRGPGPLSGAGLAAEVAQLRVERDRLKAEAARYQALARLAHGAFGAPLTTASAPPPAGGTTGLAGAAGQRARRAATIAATTRTSPAARTRKKRTPTVRALRLAARVQGTAPPTSRGGASTPPTQPATPPRGQPGG